MEHAAQPALACTVVPVAGRLDTVTAADFEKQCIALIADGARRMVLELTDLQYISSSGLRSMLVVAKRLQAVGGTLALCHPTGIVQEVIAVSGFDSLLPIYDSLDAIDAAAQ